MDTTRISQEYSLRIEQLTKQLNAASGNGQVELLLQRGAAYRAHGFPENAIMDFSLAISLNPAGSKGYYERGRAHENYLRFNRAIDDYSAAIGIEPTNATYHYARGNAWLRIGEYEKSLRDYQIAMSIDPTNASYFGAAGRACLYYGHRWKKAHEYCSTYLSMTNHSDLIRFDLGLIFFYEENYLKADESFSMYLATENLMLFPSVALLSFLTKMLLGRLEAGKKELEAINSKVGGGYRHVIGRFFGGKETLKQIWEAALAADSELNSQGEAIMECCFFVGEYFLALGDLPRAYFFLTRVSRFESFSPYLSPYALIASRAVKRHLRPFLGKPVMIE